jgi:hypothetical protein
VALLRRRSKKDLKPLSEAEAYARCHGNRGDDVRIVKVEPRRPRYETDVSGEHLREAFESRLDTREPSDEVEPNGELEPFEVTELSEETEPAPGES